jgi:hypothetical protein
MPVTYAKAAMTLTDASALADASASSTDNQSSGDLTKLKSLDNSSVAFISTAASGEGGAFETPPKISISFTNAHTLPGITLYFASAVPKSVRFACYDSRGTWIAGGTYTPDSLTYFCRLYVEKCTKITVEFLSMEKAGLYAQLRFIMYGAVLSWEDDQIKEAKVTEETDESLSALPASAASITVLDKNDEFNLANTSGLWKELKVNQPVVLSVYKDGKIIDFGTFYVKSWSYDSNTATFQCQDVIGLMDSFTFYEGRVYSSIQAKDIVSHIMTAAGITGYSMDDDLGSIRLSGHLKIQSCRSALKEVCAAIGAVAERTREGAIRIHSPMRHITSYIKPERKILGDTKVSQDSYVSGIKISFSSYAYDSSETQAYTGTLTKGKHRIEFSQPFAAGLTATGCSIEEEHTNYAVVSVSSEGDCTITGHQYGATSASVLYQIGESSQGEKGETKSYSFSLINSTLFERIAQQLLSYYGLRQIVELSYFPEEERIGDWVGIEDVNGYMSATLICQQTIDLTGGYIAQAKCRGYNRVRLQEYYMPDDIKADGNVII